MASIPTRLLSGFLFSFATLLFAMGGGGIAFFVESNSEAVYESHAVFQIAPNWIAGNGVSAAKVEKLVELCDLPHGKLLSSRANVESCLIENRLFQLASFFDQPKHQCVDWTLENLKVIQISEDAKIYKVVLHASNPQDVATIINNLVKHYHEKLVLEAPDMRSHYTFKMLEVARVGNQISPILPKYLLIGVGAAVLLVAGLWFSVNPFTFKYPTISLVEMIVVLTLTALSFAAAMTTVWWLGGTTEYVSTAKVLIQNKSIELSPAKSAKEKRLAELGRMPHHVLFKQYSQIEKCLDDYNLYDLDTFLALAKEDVIYLVQSKLDIVSDADEPQVFEVSYHAGTPEDCKRVLEKLVATYLKSLDEQYDEIQRLNLKLKSAATENGTASPVSGLSNQYQTKMLAPTSDAVPVLRRPSSWTAGLFAGYAAGLLSLVVWLIWRATRDQGNKKRERNATDGLEQNFKIS